MKSNTLKTTGLLGLLGAMSAGAEDVNWLLSGPFSWFDSAIWGEGAIPVDGESVNLEVGNVTWMIDVHNASNPGDGVNLPSSDLRIGRGTFFDSSAGGDPLLADDGITANLIAFNGAGGTAPTINVPVVADTFTSNRHGAVFNREITVNTIRAESGHQDKWQVNVSPTGTIGLVVLDERRGADGGTIDGFFAFNADAEVAQLDHVWSRLQVGAGATLSVDTYNYTFYTNQVSDNNLNPVVLDGDMTVMTFNMIDITTGTPVAQSAGTWGAIGSGADNEVDWITGAGLLTVIDGSASIVIESVTLNGANVEIEFTGAPNTDYKVTESPDLESVFVDTAPLVETTTDGSGEGTMIWPLAGPVKFARVEEK